MKVDTSKIAGYDSMTAEQKIAALEAFDMDPGEGFVAKSKLDKAASEAAEYKRQLREKQTEQEKKDAEEAEAHKKLQEEHDKLLRELAVSKFTAEFVAQGYPADLAQKTAEAMQSGDMATVLANQKTFLADFAKNAEAEALRKMKEPNGGGAGGSEDDAAVALAKTLGQSVSGDAKSVADAMAGYIINN